MTLGRLSRGFWTGGGLLREHIEAGAGQFAGRQRVIKRLLVDNAATRRVDQVGPGLHQREPWRIEHPDRLRRLRAVNADEIRARQRGVEIADRLAAGRLDVRDGLVRIEDQNLHFHGLAALR